jgi:hypothetical protein
MHTHTHTPSSTRSRAQPFRPHQPTDTARTLGMVTALATAAHPTPTNTTSGVIARPTQGAPLARPSYSGHCERRLRPHLSQPCDPHFPLMPLVSHARDCHSPAPAGHLHSALSPLHTHLQPNTRATHPRTRSHGFSRRRCQQPSTPHRASRVRLPHGSPARTRRRSLRSGRTSATAACHPHPSTAEHRDQARAPTAQHSPLAGWANHHCPKAASLPPPQRAKPQSTRDGALATSRQTLPCAQQSLPRISSGAAV